MKELIKPGYFGKQAAADSLRQYFDFKNDQLFFEGLVPDYIFIGDSITQYWDLYLYFNREKLIINRGIGGDITENILRRSDADLFQFSPKNAVFMAGINDILSTAPDLWWRKPGADKETVMKGIFSNIEAFAAKCTSQKLYICSVLPTDICPPYDKDGINEMVLCENEFLKTLCKRCGTRYVDYHSAFCRDDKKTMKDGLSYDGIHPNPNGYRIMADILKEETKEL